MSSNLGIVASAIIQLLKLMKDELILPLTGIHSQWTWQILRAFLMVLNSFDL